MIQETTFELDIKAGHGKSMSDAYSQGTQDVGSDS